MKLRVLYFQLLLTYLLGQNAPSAYIPVQYTALGQTVYGTFCKSWIQDLDNPGTLTTNQFSYLVDCAAMRINGNNDIFFGLDGWHHTIIYGRRSWERIVFMEMVGGNGSSSQTIEFNNPRAIASHIYNADIDRFVFVADTKNIRIAKLYYNNMNRSLSLESYFKKILLPNDIEIYDAQSHSNGSDDQLWIVESGRQCLTVMDVNGVLLENIFTYFDESGQIEPFKYPSSVAISNTGAPTRPDKIYVVENPSSGVSCFTVSDDFTLTRNWEVVNFDAGFSISDMDVDNFGDLLILDQNNSVVYKMTPDGEVLCKWGHYGQTEVDLQHRTLGIRINQWSMGVSPISLADSF